MFMANRMGLISLRYIMGGAVDFGRKVKKKASKLLKIFFPVAVFVAYRFEFSGFSFSRLLSAAMSKRSSIVSQSSCQEIARGRDGAMFDGYHSPSDSPKYRPIVRTDRAVALALPWAE